MSAQCRSTICLADICSVLSGLPLLLHPVPLWCVKWAPTSYLMPFGLRLWDFRWNSGAWHAKQRSASCRASGRAPMTALSV